MSFTFRPAVRERTSLLIGIAGPSGAGKTFSALKLASGLKNGGKIAMIDTEAGRALHYADQFDFDVCDLTAPFSPERYCDAVVAAELAGYDVIVIDSMSHEWEGIGGLQEQADELMSAGVKSPSNWIKPKARHQRMVNRMLQVRSHLIFCLRAKEKIKLVKNDKGKTEVVADGWHPICERNFMYELTASFMVLPEQPGVPIPIKLQAQHRAAVPLDQPISAEVGKSLRAWANGGKAPDAAAKHRAELLRLAEAAADKGTEEIRELFKGWPPADRALLSGEVERLRAIAAESDANKQGDPLSDDPFAPATSSGKPSSNPEEGRMPPPADSSPPAATPSADSARPPLPQKALDLIEAAESAKDTSDLAAVEGDLRDAKLPANHEAPVRDAIRARSAELRSAA